MTRHYLHNTTRQISFEPGTSEGHTDKVIVSIITLDSAEPMSTRILALEESRELYADLRVAGYKKGPANQGVNVKPIKAALDKAHRNGVKAPKMLVDGFCFTRAKDHSKNPGSIYVKAGKDFDATYYGKISPDGVFMPSYDCTREVEERLAAITDDVVAAAKAYGRKTGRCSFCSRTLTHGVSIALSYGPICAENYGMPHDYEDRSVIPTDE